MSHPDIVKRLSHLAYEESLERRRHAAALAAIEARREDVRSACRHPKTVSRGDASLGDAYRECWFCGAQLPAGEAR